MPVEGLHPGLDFAASHGDSVLLPTDSIRITRGCYFNQYSGYALAIGYESASTEGWYLGHLKVEDPGDYPFTYGSVVMDHQALAPCSLYNGQGPLHMHLQWTDIPLPAVPPGLHNPFDFFENSLIGYDEVQFNHVRWEEFLSPAANRGIWFTADNHETYTQLGWVTDQNTFQNIIHGAVDIAVAPFSAFQGITEEDSAGVYSVSYKILRQDPITLIYLPAASGAGNFGQRWLMEMRDELPHGDSPGYRAIFPDGQLANNGGGLDPFWSYNMNAYIVTNSGALDIASWTTGWDNVWTDPYLNDWTTGICQGAWDTFLAVPNIWPNPPTWNSEAFFPDVKHENSC